MGDSFYIVTMGCQMNVYDSDCVAQILMCAGYRAVTDPLKADVILINTCTVRSKADQKALSTLGRMTAIKKKRPHVVLGVLGCYAQREGEALWDRFPDLDIVAGPREIDGLLEYLSRVREGGERIVATGLHGLPPRTTFSDGYFTGKSRGYITIMQGCNNFCTYCIVPYVRGREICRSPMEIRREAESLVSAGVRDITLLGQNVNSYRWLEGSIREFSHLIRELSALPGLLRLRFTTSHPKDLSEDLISCFGTLETLCAHIHLPFQAGSNRVLERMGRGYTREDYMGLVTRLRKSRPDIAITSDVMVGFPGEAEEDFQLTLDLVERVWFDSLFSFKYSDRKGTVAEKMGPKIEEGEKARRLQMLQAFQRQMTLRKNQALEGVKLEILVEGESKKGGQLTGRTTTNKLVNFNGNIENIGNIINVVIKRGYMNSLWAEMV